jgi:hypothetical protein
MLAMEEGVTVGRGLGMAVTVGCIVEVGRAVSVGGVGSIDLGLGDDAMEMLVELVVDVSRLLHPTKSQRENIQNNSFISNPQTFSPLLEI